jgi:predicted nucleotidyltransferase component of viral defense system
MSAKGMSLKARIRNMAKDKNISAQALLQNYIFEHFLERLSLSDYRDKFILKGGVLVAAIVGLDTRSTMDLDTTIRDLPLNEESLIKVLTEICAVPLSDGVSLVVDSVKPIRPDDVYGGYCASLTAYYDMIETPISIDITTGDVITPDAVRFSLPGLFEEDKEIKLWAYNIETVLAEKIETILRRNVLNTRPRDFYDIYILYNTKSYDSAILHKAIAATAAHRGTTEQIADKPKLISMIAESSDLRAMWEKYSRQFAYANNVTYESAIGALKILAGINANAN